MHDSRGRAQDREVHPRPLQQPGGGLPGPPGPLVKRGGAPDPVQVLRGRVPGFEDPHPELGGPVSPLGLRLSPRIAGALDVAQHRLGLGREARLHHHHVPAQIHDVVHVLDGDRAGLHAGAAGHAVPDRLLGHGAGDQGSQFGLGPSAVAVAAGAVATVAAAATGGHDRAAVGEQLVAQAHDHQLGRQDLAGGEGRTGVLAAPAFGAREGVEHLLPGQVSRGAGAEADVLLGHVGVVEAQRLEPAAGAGAPEPHVEGRAEDVQMLGARQVGEEEQDRAHVQPHEHPLEHPGDPVVGEQVGEHVRDRGPAGGPLVEAQGDAARLPQQQRAGDRGDQAQDQVGLAQMAAPEAVGTLHLADPDGARAADQDQRGEDVGQQREPALVAEPGQRRVLVDHPDQRDQDRRRQHQEAPEDERVHQAGHQPLQQLALTEHDRRFVADPLLDIAGAIHRRSPPDQPEQEANPGGEQRSAHRDQRGEHDRGYHHPYEPLAFLISCEIAGTIWCRSPITA